MKRLPIEKLYGFIIFVVALCFSSCISTKSLIYFQNNSKSPVSDSIAVYLPIYCVNDLLTITVNGADALSVQPFNKMSGSSALTGDSKDGKAEVAGMEYLIDETGMIDFPVIGKLKIAGLNRTDAKKLLIEKLKVYVTDPIVDIRIKNFKITILGEVMRTGTFLVSDERITLPQAISLAGDIKVTGIHDNILVVREKEGKKVEYRVSLNSKEVFNSPVYYLRQNDIVYIEPHRGVAMNANNNSSSFLRSNISLLTSILSVALTLIVLLNIKK